MEAAAARRNWLLAIADEKVDKDEFVWIQFESRRGGYGEVWKDTAIPPDGRDQDAYRVAKKAFVFDTQPLNDTEQFVADVKAKFTQPPFNCNNCTDIDPVSAERRGNQRFKLIGWFPSRGISRCYVALWSGVEHLHLAGNPSSYRSTTGFKYSWNDF